MDLLPFSLPFAGWGPVRGSRPVPTAVRKQPLTGSGR